MDKNDTGGTGHGRDEKILGKVWVKNNREHHGGLTLSFNSNPKLGIVVGGSDAHVWVGNRPNLQKLGLGGARRDCSVVVGTGRISGLTPLGISPLGGATRPSRWRVTSRCDECRSQRADP